RHHSRAGASQLSLPAPITKQVRTRSPLPQGGEGSERPTRARDYNVLTATLRNLTTPSPNCSATGPSVCTPLRTLDVFLPSNMMARSRPLAVISMVLHLLPALGIGSTSA